MRLWVQDTIIAVALVTLPIWLDYYIAFGKALW
jgi:hypothetical protein